MDDTALRILLTAAGSSVVAVLTERRRAKHAERTRRWREERTERVRLAFYGLAVQLRHKRVLGHLRLLKFTERLGRDVDAGPRADLTREP